MNQNSHKRINKAFLEKIKYGIVIKLIKRTLLDKRSQANFSGQKNFQYIVMMICFD